MAVTLTGAITDVTTQPINTVTNVTAKAAVPTPSSTGLVTTQPVNVAYTSSTGAVSLTLAEGVKAWLYIEGLGWSDSVPLIATAGMTKLWQAAANALGIEGLADYLELLEQGTAAIQAKADAAVAAAIAPQTITGGTDWDTLLTHRTYARKYAVTNDLNSPPTNNIGVLYVDNPGHSSNACSQTFFSTSGVGIWHRERNATGVWTDWSRLDSSQYESEMARVITGGTDWNTLLENGFYFRRSTVTNDVNSPTNVLGVLFVANGGHSSNALAQVYFAASGDGIYYRARNATGVWTEWSRLDGGGGSGSGDATGAARRDFLVSQLHDRKGGTIGTGGKAAVAFRFDHWMTQFNILAVPLLEKYNMPWAQALNARSDNGYSGGTMNWAATQAKAISTGGEVFNHSATHRDAQTSDKLIDEIVTGRDELRAKFPLLTIDGWMQPGTSGSYGGLQPYRNEDDYATEAGTLVANYHAIVYGYRGGFTRLDGEPSIGQGHLSMDRLTVAQVKQHIDRAVSLGAGVVLMMHPNALDGTLENSKMTAAAFEEVLKYVDALRTAGKLEVLSASGLQVADSSHGTRRHLIDVDLTGSGTGYRDLGWEQVIADGPHEVHATIKSAGTVTIRVATADNVLNKTWTLSINGWREVWLPFTLPVGASRVTVTTTGATGGRLAVRPI